LAAAVLAIALAIGSVGSATLAGRLHSPKNPDLLLIEYLEKQHSKIHKVLILLLSRCGNLPLSILYK
jgi:hypothetical protein